MTDLALAEPDRTELADLGRTRIRLWHWGDDAAPPVLLLHGGFDHGRMWDDLAPRLAALGHHVVAWDARGHGDSGRLHGSGSYWPMFLLDAAQVAQRLGPPVRVVGHSFGGGLSLAFASAFPELVERVVNIDGLGPPPELMRVQDHAAVARQWLADAQKIQEQPQREYGSVEEMAQKRKEINTRLPIAWCRHLARHGARRGPGGGWLWKSDPHFRLGSPQPFGEAVLRAQYRRLRCPVLVLTGAEPDQWNDLPAEVRDDRLAVMGDVEHHVVDGAGHYVHIEQPDETVAHITRFFS